jgi:ABC-2 type transport system ATP-binding protein
MVDEMLLRTEGLSFRYPSGTLALEDLTVDVPRGSVGLVGANGAGKTTLLRLALGQLRPTAGRIEVGGRTVADDPVGVRAHLGFMPEHDCLPPDQTAADVVASLGELSGLPPRAARQRASEVLDLVGLDEARFRSIGEFSTGMRQRTKLAQAIVGDPELILLDEPTAGLAPSLVETVVACLKEINERGTSLVLIEHETEVVFRVCRDVYVLSEGKQLARGTPAEIRSNTQVLDLYLGAPK